MNEELYQKVAKAFDKMADDYLDAISRLPKPRTRLVLNTFHEDLTYLRDTMFFQFETNGDLFDDEIDRRLRERYGH